MVERLHIPGHVMEVKPTLLLTIALQYTELMFCSYTLLINFKNLYKLVFLYYNAGHIHCVRYGLVRNGYCKCILPYSNNNINELQNPLHTTTYSYLNYIS